MSDPNEEKNISETEEIKETAPPETGTCVSCQGKCKEYLEGWQRAKADLANHRKDEVKRFEEMAQYIAAGLIQDLLPVLDSFDLALGHTADKEMERGIILIRSQFLEILKRRGIEEIHVKKGEAFNPEQHESIGEMASTEPAGTIAEEAQKGYMLQGRVIRPARVKIAKEK